MNTSSLECGILIHYNEQNSKITERMRAGNGKQLIILQWPYACSNLQLLSFNVSEYCPLQVDHFKTTASLKIYEPFVTTRFGVIRRAALSNLHVSYVLKYL